MDVFASSQNTNATMWQCCIARLTAGLLRRTLRGVLVRLVRAFFGAAFTAILLFICPDVTNAPSLHPSFTRLEKSYNTPIFSVNR